MTLLVSATWLAPFPTLAQESAYEQHLKGMGHLLFRCSSHNLIFGLDLTASQIRRLGEMASWIDALSPPVTINSSATSDLAPVVKVFQRLEDALRRRVTIPEAFRQELLEVRRQQSTLLRKGLRYDLSSKPLSCARCHWVPGSRKWVALPWIDKVAQHPGIRKEQALSHMIAPFGLVSLAAVCWYAGEIDGLLCKAQQMALASFTCCLLPPRDFADPIRVGQAALGGWEIDVLQRLRSASRWSLPLVKFGVKRALIKGFKALHPGATASQIAEIKERIDRMADKVRALSEVDFELQKEALCRELAFQERDPLTSAIRKLNQAMFLLIPGASDVYRSLLDEKESQEARTGQ